jgi:F-type H+-transporting ATPase subunit b
VIPDLSVLWVIFFVLLSVWVVNALILKPILRIMHERGEAIASARALAERAAAEAAAGIAEFEARTTAARAEVYREMDKVRREALATREQVLASTREEVEKTASEAAARVRAEADAARAQLTRDADALGNAIAERVLGRKIS